ncbi:MAG: MFS transporter [Dehalococcoidia bacterium]
MTVRAPARGSNLPGPLRSLRFRDYRLLLAATVMQNLTMPMQFITLTFWAADTYEGKTALVSSLIMGVRGAGMLLFSFLGGAFADRFERRKVLLVCECTAFTVTALMGLTMVTKPFGDATIAAVIGLVFLSAANMATDGPSRTASIPVIVGQENMASAIALNNVAQQLTFPLIIPIVGFLSGTIGPGKVVLVSLVAWAVIFPSISLLKYSSRNAVTKRRSVRGTLQDVRAGLRYAKGSSAILAIIGMLATMQVVGMPGVGMLGPVWMTEVLDLSRAQFGLVAMLWGVGALVSSLVFALWVSATRRATTLAGVVVCFAVAGIVFAHSREPVLTAAANAVLGAAMTGAMVTAMTTIQYAVADDMRGRVMGLFPLVMGGSMLAVAPVGAVSQVVGLELVVPILEWATLGIALLLIATLPVLRGSPVRVPRPAPETA